MQRIDINRFAALICLVSMTVTSRAGMAQTLKELAGGSPVTGLAGDRWTSQVFKVSVPVDQTRLTIATRGSTVGREAGVTLYAKHGAQPTTTV